MRAGIALGSNIGDRIGFLREGKKRLLKLHEGETPALSSSVYETEAVDCEPGTPSFLNAIVEIKTSLAPFDLLDRAQQIESDLGRPSEHAKNSPRTVDVDLLYIGDQIIQSERLAIPHPRAAERLFVLAPLCEIRPDLNWPGTTNTVSDLLNRLSQAGSERPPETVSWKW